MIATCLGADGSTVTYLAIRGSYNLNDWKTNFKTWPSYRSDLGVVHPGWYNRASGLPMAYLMECLTRGDRIVLTGHSLGGAVATLLTSKLLNFLTLDDNSREKRKRLLCVTFASPLVMSGVGAVNLNSVCLTKTVLFTSFTRMTLLQKYCPGPRVRCSP